VADPDRHLGRELVGCITQKQQIRRLYTHTCPRLDFETAILRHMAAGVSGRQSPEVGATGWARTAAFQDRSSARDAGNGDTVLDFVSRAGSS
jgi:hypothetical protein